MGGCYSAYASSRKLRGRISKISLVIPDPVPEAEAASPRKDGVDGDGDDLRGCGGGCDDGGNFFAIATTTADEFARRDAATGEALACKTIRKHRRLAPPRVTAAKAAAAHGEDVKREVAIMRRMSSASSSRGGGAASSAAVVRLREACEDAADGSVHLVMELCEGGELFDRIVARGHYSERAAANIFRTIVDVVQLCHSNGVIHRDLKPENFLFANKSEDSPLKVIDFGLSVFFKPGTSIFSKISTSHRDRFTEVVGSAYYMAPEVLRRSYGPEVDVWSAGVILYILLCGVPPFWGDNDEKIAQAILRGAIDFNREPLPRVSANAKDLVRRMLDPNPSTRLTAKQVLEHPWLKNADTAPNVSLGDAVRARLQQFSAMNKFKKKALGADTDGNGTLDCDEFVTVSVHLKKMSNDEYLAAAFNYFDKDGSGFIELDELREEVGPNEQAILEILRDVDTDKDGRISYQEFELMMKSGADWRNASRHFSRANFSTLSRRLCKDTLTP
ncbi:hypothetical protein OsJ_28121 [Oryza sativa Japonica Group]|uniref:Uncharacterized protein n=1 Tax=Oryza sativa subsp. japonica TaxID=39947 RepID=A3BVB6_ORYSJ|nr:hypothetical protein OsJ_28121 [Oryza sativa Japonica Group]